MSFLTFCAGLLCKGKHSNSLVAPFFYRYTCFFYYIVVVQVFSIFEDLGISVDSVATSEVSISLTLDPSKLWSRELIQQVKTWDLIPLLCSVICQQYCFVLPYCCVFFISAPVSLFSCDVAGA